jgi:hypothetical protein
MGFPPSLWILLCEKTSFVTAQTIEGVSLLVKTIFSKGTLMTSYKVATALNMGRLRKKVAGKARESRGVRRTFAYAAATREEAQRSIRTFYEAVNGYIRMP